MRSRLSEMVDEIGLAGEDCLIWPYSRTECNYGRLGIKWRGVTYKKAHRLAWAIEHDNPGEMCVLHSCDNPPCYNPKHLYLGTQQDNLADMCRKGRQRGGAKRREFCRRGLHRLEGNRTKDMRCKTCRRGKTA